MRRARRGVVGGLVLGLAFLATAQDYDRWTGVDELTQQEIELEAGVWTTSDDEVVGTEGVAITDRARQAPDPIPLQDDRLKAWSESPRE